MIWLNIEGYEGIYQLSEKGELRRKLKNKKFRIIKPCKASNGLSYVTLWKNNSRKNYMLHNLYAETFHVSVVEAKCVIYKGYTTQFKAKENIRIWILEKISDCETQTRAGNNLKTEIMYLKSFLDKL